MMQLWEGGIIGREISKKFATSASIQKMKKTTGMDFCCNKYAGELITLRLKLKPNDTICLTCDKKDLPINIPGFASGVIGPGRTIDKVFQKKIYGIIQS